MSQIPQDKEKDFIREKIVRHPVTHKDCFFYVLAVVGTAILFGVIACVTFVGLRPILESHWNKETESSQIETEEIEDKTLESEAENETKSMADELNSEDIEVIVSSYLEKNKLEVKDYTNLYDSISKLTKNLSKSVVKVTAVTQDVDWFDTSYEKEGTVSGIILEITKNEIQILTDYTIVKQADQIKVTFIDNSQATAKVLSFDKTEGFSLISVQRNDISENTVSRIAQVEVADSQVNVTEGMPILVLGSPTGSVGSVEIGLITFISQNSQAVDGTHVLIDTNIAVTGNGNSWLFSMNGQLLGIYQTSLSDDERKDAVSVVSLLDEIEQMKKQKNLPCLGIYGQDVTDEISTNYQLPYGIYVTNTVKKGAAYKAGVQNGDVITKMNGESVLTLQTLQSEILKKQSGEEITLTVQRSGADGYKELQLSVKLGKR
jgi:serine protease Do